MAPGCYRQGVWRLAPVMLLAIAASGCPVAVDDGSACAPNDDCGPNAVCTDIAECAPTTDAPPWRIRWTINGAAISPDAHDGCDSIEELALTVTSFDDMVSYRPVTCSVGEFDFTALPSRFDQVVLEAFAGGALLDRELGDRASVTTVELSF